MIKPNLFGVLADALEESDLAGIAPAALAFCIVGFWVFTGSLFAALALTLLAIVPLALLVGISTVGLWAGLRLLDSATSLLRHLPAR